MFGSGIAKGMRMTFRRLVGGTVTEFWPYERRQLSSRARCMLAMGVAEDGSADCRACGTCEKTCPDHAIAIEKDPEDPKRILRMTVDHGRCTFCGLCVEGCPSGLHFEQTFDYASHDRSSLVITLIENGEPRRWTA